MKFGGPLLFVKHVMASRLFYEELLGERIRFDIGACQCFESGLTLQAKSSAKELMGIDFEENHKRGFMLYFEAEEFDRFMLRLSEYEVEYPDDKREPWQYEWGQRAIRFLDPDGYLIEVAESMGDVIRRFRAQGLTPRDIADCIMLPLDYIMDCLK